MGDHLRGRPVHGVEVHPAQAAASASLLAHLCGRNQNFEFDAQGSVLLVGLRLEIRQGLRIFLGARASRCAKRRERLGGHNPGRNSRGKILPEKRSQRLILPGLNIASGPIVHQAKTKDVLIGFSNRDPAAQSVACANVQSGFEFVVEAAAGSICRRVLT